MKKTGDIIIKDGAKPWPHELRTAEALAALGISVTFIRKSDIEYEKTADVLIDGNKWEFKSPRADKIKAIERNIRRAIAQSHLVVFDSRRMKGLPDSAIERELRICAGGRIKDLERLIFVNRHGNVIDIK